MRRRHLLALAPAAALAACTDQDPRTPDTGASDGGGSEPETRTSGPAADPTSEATTEPPSAVELLLEELSPRELAGQLVLVGIPAGTEIPEPVLTEHHAGGIFLLQVWESADAVESTIATARERSRADLPPPGAVDQEGGQGGRPRGPPAPGRRRPGGRSGEDAARGRRPPPPLARGAGRPGPPGGGRGVREHRRGPRRPRHPGGPRPGRRRGRPGPRRRQRAGRR